MKHDNIIPFRNPNKLSSRSDAKAKAKNVIKISVYKIILGLFVIIRYALFFLLLWIRTPIRFILKLITVPMPFTFSMVFFGLSGHPQKTTMLIWLISVGFISFALLWFYDSLLLWISPEDIALN